MLMGIGGPMLCYLLMAFCGPERFFRSPSATILQRPVTSSQRPLAAVKKETKRKIIFVPSRS